MTIAEKYYRMFYKVNEEVKLTTDQWKVVKMMHECLREYNKPKLPNGAILVNKKHLVDHLWSVKKCLQDIDQLMQDPKYREFSRGEAGACLANICNSMQFSSHSIMHFQLNIPIERLNDDLEHLKENCSK